MWRLGLFCAATGLFLSSCAGLGALKLEGISNESPPADYMRSPAYVGYFKVALSSTTVEKFLESSGRDSLYVTARLCPVAGGEDVEIIAGLPDTERKRQIYDVYLVARYTGPHRRYSAGTLEPQNAYDLAKDKRDVCIRLTSPGLPAAAWSEELRVPAETLRQARAAE